VILSGCPTNNAKTGGCIATWVMKADFVIFVGLPFRTGRGWVVRISWRNLFKAPVGIRFENAANTRSIVGKSWPSESECAAEAKRTGAHVRKGMRRCSSCSTSCRALVSPYRRSHLLTRRKQARPCLMMIPAILVSCSVTPSVASRSKTPRSDRPIARCDLTTL
jgi:hypothetical protein